MVKAKKYSLDGKELGEVNTGTLATAEANSQMVKDYIVAIRENKRQWSASTKTRAEVKHTTAKPRPQKGTGSARQGCLVAPQFRGGGIVFGPRPKFDQHVRINKKERRLAIASLIASKIKSGNLHVIASTEMDAPKTKTIVHLIDKLGLTKGRVLFLGESEKVEVETDGKKVSANIKCRKHENFARSLRNIPKTEFSLATQISGYDVMVARNVVITEPALTELQQWLCG